MFIFKKSESLFEIVQKSSEHQKFINKLDIFNNIFLIVLVPLHYQKLYCNDEVSHESTKCMTLDDLKNIKNNETIEEIWQVEIDYEFEANGELKQFSNWRKKLMPRTRLRI